MQILMNSANQMINEPESKYSHVKLWNSNGNSNDTLFFFLNSPVATRILMLCNELWMVKLSIKFTSANIYWASAWKKQMCMHVIIFCIFLSLLVDIEEPPSTPPTNMISVFRRKVQKKWNNLLQECRSLWELIIKLKVNSVNKWASIPGKTKP